MPDCQVDVLRHAVAHFMHITDVENRDDIALKTGFVVQPHRFRIIRLNSQALPVHGSQVIGARWVPRKIRAPVP